MTGRRNLSQSEWDAIQADMAADIAVGLQQLANTLAARLLEKMRAEACGQHVYISAPARYDEEAVLASFTGRNAEEVCREHNISKATFYRILKRRQPGA